MSFASGPYQDKTYNITYVSFQDATKLEDQTSLFQRTTYIAEKVLNKRSFTNRQKLDTSNLLEQEFSRGEQLSSLR